MLVIPAFLLYSISMARSRWTDFLNDHLFWAMDVSSAKNIPIFTPLFGFSGITAPRIQIEMDTFKDGTYIYPRNVVKSASVNEITFTRAASLYDSDFYDWIYQAIYGTTAAKDIDPSRFTSTLAKVNGGVRRNILIFQFARVNLAAGDSTAGRVAAGAAIGAVVGAAAGGLSGAVAGAGVGVGAGIAGGLSGGAIPVGPFTYAAWLPARAWLLHECVPVSYSSGSDFDANSGAISLMNLTIAPEYIEEYSMGIRP
jgi:hypothetical protein